MNSYRSSVSSRDIKWQLMAPWKAASRKVRGTVMNVSKFSEILDWCRGWDSNPHDLAVNGF
jgi:hypothetical protein